MTPAQAHQVQMEFNKDIGTKEFEEFLEKYEIKRLHVDIFERSIMLVMASLGLIAALAWDDALKHLFAVLFGSEGSLEEELSYAVVITVIAVFVSTRLSKLFTKRRLQK